MRLWKCIFVMLLASISSMAELPSDIRIPQGWILYETDDVDLLGASYRIRMYFSKSLVDERDKGNVFYIPVITELDGGTEKIIEAGESDLYTALNYYASLYYNRTSCYQFFREGDRWVSDCEAWAAYYDNTLYDTDSALLATGIQISKTAIGMLLTAGASSPTVLVEWSSNLYDRFNSIYGSLAVDRLHAAAAGLAFADPSAYENATGEFGDEVWRGVEKYFPPEYKAMLNTAYGNAGSVVDGIEFIEKVEAYHWLKVNGFGELSGGAGKVLASGGALIGNLAVGQLATMATDAEALHQENLRIQNFHALALWHVCNQGANTSLSLPYCITPSELMEQCILLKYLNWHRLRTLQMLCINALDYNEMLLGDSWVKWLGDEKRILDQMKTSLEASEDLFSSFQKDVRSLLLSCQVADEYFAVIYPTAVTIETPQVIKVTNSGGVLRVEPGSLSFGTIPEGSAATIPLVAFNSGGSSGFSWQARGLDSGPFSIVGAASGIISSRESLELLIQYDGVSEGNLSDHLLLTATFGDGTVETLSIDITANAVDPEDFTSLDRPLEFARGIFGSVQDGTYLSKQYASGAWEDLGWQGASSRLRTLALTNNTVATSVVKFDLPEGLDDAMILSAELCIQCASVERSGKVVLYEHGYSFTEASCVFAEYRTDRQYLDMSIVSTPREVTFQGSRLRDLVQKWTTNPSSNKGLLMVALGYADLSFYSSEDSTVVCRPCLTIEYQHADRRAPSLSISTPRSGWSQAGSCTVSGHASDFHGIDRVTVNGGRASLSSVDDRTYSFSKDIQLQPGRNEIKIVAEDGSLEENTRTKSVTVYTPDVALVLGDYNLQLSQGDSEDIWVSCRGLYGFDSQVMLNFDGSPLGLTLDETVVSIGGRTKLRIGAGENLAPGEYQVILRAEGGGVERLSEVTVRVIDGKAPELFVSTPSENVITTEAFWTITGSARDIGSSGLADVSFVSARPVGELSNKGTLGSWKFDVPLEGGHNVFYIIAKDNAGNETRTRCDIIKASVPESAPVVTNIINGAIGVAVVDVELEWGRVIGADAYRTYLGTDSNDVAASGGAANGVIELITARAKGSLPTLTSGITYYYRVEAVNDYGVVSSPVRSFSTLGDDIFAEWRFENIAGGVCKDITGNGYDLAWSDSSPVSGLLGNGLLFNADGQNATAAGISHNGSLSLGFWFKGQAASTDAAVWSSLVSVGGLPLEINGDNRLRVKIGYGEWMTDTLPADVWNYVLFSVDKPGNLARISVFSDNEWSHKSCPAVISAVNDEVMIGSSMQDGVFFNGLVDEVSVVGVAVSQSECDNYVARVRDSVRFNYTIKIQSKSGAAVYDATVLMDGFGQFDAPTGMIVVAQSPGMVAVVTEADHHDFAESSLNLRWKDEVHTITPVDDRPFGCSVDVPGYASVGNTVSVTSHGFDFEAGVNDYFVTPYKVRAGPDGFVYILDKQHSKLYRTVDGQALEVVAGTGAAGYNGDGIAAAHAQLNHPWALCLDDVGNIYIADTGNHRIRKIDAGGIITTFAGTGVASTDDATVSGVATSCQINSPEMVEYIDGYVYLDDEDREAVLRVNNSGSISLYALIMGDTLALVKDTDGSMLALDDSDMILKLNGVSSYSIYSGNYQFDHMGDGADVGRGGFNEATDLVIGSGYMAVNTKLVADHSVRRLRYENGGKWYTFAGNGRLGFPLYGHAARTCALRLPVSCDSDGSNIYIADEGNYSIFKVDAVGDMRKFFESGCIPTAGILEYQVDFGDGTLSEWSTSMAHEHVYEQARAYEPRARSRDTNGHVSEWSMTTSIRVYDEDSLANVTTYSDEVVNLNQVPSGTSVVARHCSVLSSGAFSIESGAKLILDNSTLYLPEGSDLAIQSGGELLTMPGSVITADNISSDLDIAEPWWSDSDDARVEFNGTRVNCRGLNLDVTSYIQRESDIVVQGANGVYPESRNGEEASFIIRSRDDIQVLNDSSFDIEGGAGANASADRATGGAGGNMWVELLSKSEVIMSRAIDIRGEGGAGGVGTSSRKPGHSGKGGDVRVSIQADGDIAICQCELYIKGGKAFDGNSSYKEVASDGGAAGSVDFSLTSVSGNVECVNLYYGGDVNDSGGGGYDRDKYTTGGDGAVGQPGSFHISAGKDLFIADSELETNAGNGGSGGDGDPAGHAASGGSVLADMAAMKDVILTNTFVGIYSGGGGHGGDGSADDGRGGAGDAAIAGAASFSVTASGLVIYDTEFKSISGDGGDAGVPDSKAGKSGASAGPVKWLWNIDSLTLARSRFEIDAGAGGKGSSGDDNSGSGGAGGSCGVDINVESFVDLASSSISISAGDGGNPGYGYYNSPQGGNGGNISFVITNVSDHITMDSSYLSFYGGDAEDGGDSVRGDGGSGGAAGDCVIQLGANNRVDFGSETKLKIHGGDGGRGGSGEERGAGGPATIGGIGMLAVSSYRDVSFSNEWINVVGGDGGTAGRGEDPSDDSSGAKGGKAFMRVSAEGYVADNTHVSVLGGVGGAGKYRSAGHGGDSELSLDSSHAYIYSSHFDVEGGLPSRNKYDVYASKGTGIFEISGESAVENSYLNEGVHFSSGADIRKTFMRSYGRVDSSASGIDIYNFISLDYSVPRPFGETWTLTYRVADLNWEVSSSIIGPVSARAEFDETFESPELGVVFNLGHKDWFVWADGDTITFSVEQPNIAAVSNEVVKLDAVHQIAVQTEGGSAYEGKLIVYGYVEYDEHTAWEFDAPPYCVSLPGWNVTTNGYSVVSGQDYKIRLQAPGACLEMTDYVAMAGVPVYTISPDSDSDGLSDATEQPLRTDALRADSDGDGLSDWEETVLPRYASADATKSDSDGDGVNDGDEVQDGTDIGNASNYGDRPPIFSFVGVGPDSPRANDEISARWVVHDPDSDLINVEYRWVYNDDRIVESGILTNVGTQPETNTLSLASPVQRDDVVRLDLVAYSSSPARWSSWINTASIVVGNSPPDPNIPSVMTVAPGEISEMELSATDIDGDSLAWSLTPPVLPQQGAMMASFAEPASDTGADHGEVEIAVDTVTYTSGLGFYTQDVFTVYCSDGIDIEPHEIQVVVAHSDSDGDGINDYEELYVHGLDPENSDTDGDSLLDGEEILLGLDPSKEDTDDDGLSDGDEVETYGTDPLDTDSDNDGLSDGDEVNIHHTDPLQLTKFTLNFNSAGGTAVSLLTQLYNSIVTAPADPMWTGHTFTGWDLTVPSIMPAEDLTLTAQWRINQYTLSFDSAGGSAVNPIMQDYGTAVTPPADPTRTGYTFAGWDPTVPTTMPAISQTLTAQWTINPYTLSFDSAGGTSIDAIIQNYGTAVTAPADPTRIGYTFAGWDLPVPSTIPARNLMITAQWIINQYMLSFDSAGGTAVDAITQDYGTAVTAPANPTWTGYTFAGWVPTVPPTMPAGNLTLTAQWTINQYTLSFDSAGGAGIDSLTQDYGTAVTAPSDPIWTGYTFTGWDPTVPSTMPAANLTLRAQYDSDPVLSTSASNLTPGCTEGQNASNEYFEVWNAGGGTLNYSISNNASWLDVVPATGSSSGEHGQVEVRYNTSGLTAGTYNAKITITAPNVSGSLKYIDVSLIVSDVFMVTDFESLVSGDLVIRWIPVEGRYYSVYRKEDLQSNAGWIPLGVNIQWPVGVFTDAVHNAESQGFYKVRVGTTPIEEGDPDGMVQIPSGTVFRDSDFGGDSLNNPTAFYMDATEVTKAQWNTVYNWAVANGYSFDNTGSGKGLNHPVHTVNWYDCVKWCNARSEVAGKTPCYDLSDWSCDVSANGYRLPTSDEWEYAARGGLSGKRFPWGDTITHSLANYYSYSSYSYDTSSTRGDHPSYYDGGIPYTSPVGSFSSNGYGLDDMSGNVSEWCNTVSGSDRDIRGGGWGHYAFRARCGNERWTGPSGGGNLIGFRAVHR